MMKKWIFSLVSITALNAQAQSLTYFNSGDTISAYTMNSNFSLLNTMIATINSKLPSSTGANGQILVSNGDGTSSWVTPAAGGGAAISSLVVSTSAVYTTPTSGTAAGVATIYIPMASTSTVTAGLLSNSDYESFMRKPLNPAQNDFISWNGSSWVNGQIPMVSATQAGLITPSDWTNFTNKIGLPANTTPQSGQMLGYSGSAWTPFTPPYGRDGMNNLNFGPMDNADLIFKTYGTEKVRITSSGSVGIGTSVPTSFLDVKTTASNTVSNYPIVQMSGSLDGVGIFQRGFSFDVDINQTNTTISGTTSNGSFAAMTVNADLTDDTSSGPKKLLELSTSNTISNVKTVTPKFVVNSNGHFTADGFMYKISTAPTTSVSCLTAPPYGSGLALIPANIGFTNDFGGGVTYTVPTATETIAEIILDIPTFTSAGTGVFNGVYGFITNGTTTYELKSGINIKRLGGGTWNFGLGCMAASGTSFTVTFGTGGIFSIRRFH